VHGSADDLGITAANVTIPVPAVMRPCGRVSSSGRGQGDANIPHELDQVARVHAVTASGLLQGDAS
jgi:hypothetical protein